MNEGKMNSVKMANINGYLLAFALLNVHTNHGYTFEFTEIEYHKNMITAFEGSFELKKDENLDDIRILTIVDWKVKIEEICEEWFFQVGYPTPTSKYVDFQKSHCIEGFIKLLSDFFFKMISNPYKYMKCNVILVFFMNVYGMILFLLVTRECFFYILDYMIDINQFVRDVWAI